ncbi:hypothetical protein [Tessaracoccus antarcticus]|uniref:hypothetical protein n=1 Tax=Tessaracoccus antarcticus TaxID=2479848 RepID=UPI0011C48A40|nr:hypothetical protein [Tessaracoccus antarcticus]
MEHMFDEEAVIRVWVPPGWPAVVRPPSSPGWVRSATSFLLDCCPPDYRGYPVLLRQPVVLARFAREFASSQLAATRANLAGARPDLAGWVDTATVDAAVAVLHAEEARMVRQVRAVSLVQDALRDVRFTPKL